MQSSSPTQAPLPSFSRAGFISLSFPADLIRTSIARFYCSRSPVVWPAPMETGAVCPWITTSSFSEFGQSMWLACKSESSVLVTSHGWLNKCQDYRIGSPNNVCYQWPCSLPRGAVCHNSQRRRRGEVRMPGQQGISTEEEFGVGMAGRQIRPIRNALPRKFHGATQA